MSNLHADLPFLAVALLLSALLALLNNVSLTKYISPTGRRLINFFLVSQSLLIVINIVMALTGTDLFPHELWHLDEELNVPTGHSTVQLLFLGGVFFLNSGVADKKKLHRERVFWIVLGFCAAILAHLEHAEPFKIDLIPEPEDRMLFDPLIILVSLLAQAVFLKYRNDRQRLIELLTLLNGLAIWAYAALRLDDVMLDTGSIVPLEETLETYGIAIALAGAAGSSLTLVPSPRLRARKLLTGLSLTLVLVAILHIAALIWQDRDYIAVRFLGKHYGKSITADVDDGALALRGWSASQVSPGKNLWVRIWLHTTRPLDSDFGFTIQLIDQETRSSVVTANKRSGIPAGEWKSGIRHSMVLPAVASIPDTLPSNRALWLTLSFWKVEDDDFSPLSIDFSDYPQMGNTHVILDELVLPELQEPSSGREPRATFANGFVLQQAVLPTRAIAGSVMEVDFQWNSTSSGDEDWTQFLHFFHLESGQHWTVDRYPLGLRLPTRLWYAGMQSAERWSFRVPEDLDPGDYSVHTGLYRLVDMERLGATLGNGAPAVNGSIALGSISVGG